MTLSAKQQNTALLRLAEVWKPPRQCPACGQEGQWTVGTIVELREYHQGLPVAGAPVTPLLKTTCANCSLTLLFNAIKLGLIKADTGVFNE
jgi:hypothetical protein